MKAIVYTQYGTTDVLHLSDVAKPTPQEHQILIKVHAASVNPVDRATYGAPLPVRLMSGNGLFKPKNQRIGVDLAGRVEAVGSAVTQLQPGDEVFGGGQGAFAEYACARADAVVVKPANIPFASAAAVPVAALTALQALRDQGKLQARQQVLIYGAGGGVGAFAVQLAKAFGAKVTALCGPKNVALMRSLGADQVIDYTQEDFGTHRQQYDLIAAVNGHQSLGRYRRALRPNGRCVVIGGSLTQVIQSLLFGPLLSRWGSKAIGFMGIAKLNQPDLVFLSDLLATGKIRPVIDRCYPLAETPVALRYLAEGHVQGKIVITVANGDQ